ncbi:MAG: amidoligase family protein, partial [Paracoccaceae bacterium]
METSGLAIRSAKRELDNAGIQGVECKPDGTPNVDCEIVLPPLAMDLEQPRTSQPAFQYLQRICNVIDMAGATVNTACGLHVHVSNAPLNDDTTAARYTGDSISHKERTGRYLNAHGEPFDAAIVKDIMLRYTEQQDVINSMLPASRRNNRYCNTLSPQRIAAADTISDLGSATHGKFSSINLQT